jgi:hypothetical protein
MLFSARHLATAASARRTARHINRLHEFAAPPVSHSLPPSLRLQITVALAPQLAIRRGSDAAAIALGVLCRWPKTPQRTVMLPRKVCTKLIGF